MGTSQVCFYGLKAEQSLKLWVECKSNLNPSSVDGKAHSLFSLLSQLNAIGLSSFYVYKPGRSIGTWPSCPQVMLFLFEMSSFVVTASFSHYKVTW